jgi:hypothetical protein
MKATKKTYTIVIILMLILITPSIVYNVLVYGITQEDDYSNPPCDESAKDNEPNEELPDDGTADSDVSSDNPSGDAQPENGKQDDNPVDGVPADDEKPNDNPLDDDFLEDQTPDDDTSNDRPSDDVPPNDDINPEDDSEEIEPENIEFLNPEYTITGLPEFVSDISECKNKKKQYVLPDGYIYEYSLYSWTKTEKYVPADWHQEIKDTVEKINKLDLPDESNVIKFMFSSDIHFTIGSVKCSTENIGKVSAEVMSACGIPYFIDAGDTCTQSAEYTPSYFEKNITCVLSQLMPIPRKNLLFAVGNHDGATGMREYDGKMVYYRYQMNNEQRKATFFDWQQETNVNKKFDSDGTYYYMDDPTTKTRYIMLNPFWSKWAGDEDGFVTDIQHSFFHTPIFGSQQLNWFANEALDMPENYGAILIAHFAPAAKDFEVFKGIVDAFGSKSSYIGSYIGAREWQSTRIAVNYENVTGEIIAIFQGNNHIDIQYDSFDTIPCINITTTGASWDVREDSAEPRVKGTATEFAVNAVIIDRVKRKIHMIRLGAGEDREIDY